MRRLSLAQRWRRWLRMVELTEAEEALVERMRLLEWESPSVLGAQAWVAQVDRRRRDDLVMGQGGLADGAAVERLVERFEATEHDRRWV